jgi:hypothetical protein
MLVHTDPLGTRGFQDSIRVSLQKLLHRKQAEVILNHDNPDVRVTGQGEARLGSIRGVKLAEAKEEGCYTVPHAPQDRPSDVIHLSP